MGRFEQYGKDCIGQIIRILDNKTLIIDAGSDTVSLGDKIAIYSPGEAIKDLNGVYLGNLDSLKDVVKVVRVEKLFAICQKADVTYPVNSAVAKSTALFLSQLATSPLLAEERVPLNVCAEEISSAEYSSKNTEIHVGDPVKIYYGDTLK